MKEYTGFEYLLIDAAAQYGHDKWTFEKRIDWARENIDKLEELGNQQKNWKEKPLYLKAVQAIRAAQKKEPIGHMVGLDASASGIQVMSCLVGCIQGATSTGLVDPDVRADIYTTVNQEMNQILSAQGLSVNVNRNDSKKALMTSFYGSKARPKELFGEDTPELEAFYQAAEKVAPGAWCLLQVLMACWNPETLAHRWQLPDGFDAVVKVITKVTAEDRRSRIEVDELDHASFTYVYTINEKQARGTSLPANVTHSVDAYVLRSVHRRCNYKPEVLTWIAEEIASEIDLRASRGMPEIQGEVPEKLAYYMRLWEETQIPDAVIFEHLIGHADKLNQKHLEQLNRLAQEMLAWKPFPIVTIHDEFRCHPNNANQMRKHYRSVMADLAEGDALSYILRTLTSSQGSYPKMSTHLPDLIRKSAYGIC